MLFCLFTSSCENIQKDLEHQHQCCNSCKNKSCPNRCHDNHKTCRLAADKAWVDSEKSKQLMPSPEVKPSAQPRSRAKEVEVDEAFVKAQAELRAKEQAKKEARKKRREARKDKAKS